MRRGCDSKPRVQSTLDRQYNALTTRPPSLVFTSPWLMITLDDNTVTFTIKRIQISKCYLDIIIVYYSNLIHLDNLLTK